MCEAIATDRAYSLVLTATLTTQLCDPKREHVKFYYNEVGLGMPDLEQKILTTFWIDQRGRTEKANSGNIYHLLGTAEINGVSERIHLKVYVGYKTAIMYVIPSR